MFNVAVRPKKSPNSGEKTQTTFIVATEQNAKHRMSQRSQILCQIPQHNDRKKPAITPT